MVLPRLQKVVFKAGKDAVFIPSKAGEVYQVYGYTAGEKIASALRRHFAGEKEGVA